MIVSKFGGTSIADRERMEHVAGIVSSMEQACVVVVSAMGATTDQLLEAARLAEADDGPGMRGLLAELQRRHFSALVESTAATEQVDRLFVELSSVLEGVRLLREQTPRSLALISSVGERLSSCILAAHLRQRGTEAEAVDARRFVVTDDRHEAARVDREQTLAGARELISPLLERGVTPIVTGFIGATPEGITTTLGRGGSDYSAALIGALLEAEEIWIWTDVDGILTADPGLVKEARTLEQVSYREAAEMSYFGARVLHPKTIGPAVAERIPIRIKNTFAPERPGTLVAETSPILPQGVKTVSSIHDLALITVEGRGMAGVPGIARRVFEASESAGVNVIMISQASSEQTISFVVPQVDAQRLITQLRQTFAPELALGAVERIEAHERVAITSIVGQGMAGTPGISGKLFNTLGAVGVNVLAIAQGASELNISVAVDQDQAKRAVRAIHSAFGLTRAVNLMVLGCGRVGQTFLRQLHETRQAMELELGLEPRLVGLADSRHLLLDEEGIPVDQASQRLERSERELPPSEELVAALQELHLTDLVLVDVTAAETTPLQLRALEAGIHVVTANKRPLSGPLSDYERLLAAARESGVGLHYETTFGAGLPVLHTLKELVQTGDRLISITGCFSGTLGYLCTRLEQGAELVEAVGAAEREGLTEPDPREDLSGRDVARKALIIARTAGMRIEADALELTPMVPDLDQGLEPAVARFGPELAERVREEGRSNRVLRFTAEITPERVRVGLQAVPRDDPVGSLRGQDNILVYRTRRYKEFPLVIRGPGAGAEVTAAGVLGDVLKAVQRR
jgi:aspartokinase/homoserine dehydrogenase 1